MPEQPLKIVVLEKESLAGIPLPQFRFAYEIKEYEKTENSQIIERIKDADIVIINKVKFSKKILSEVPNLKILALTATGTDNVNLLAAEKLGIRVQNITGYSVNSVPEHTLNLMLNLSRNTHNYISEVKKGKWQTSTQFTLNHLPIFDLNGKNLGIIGHGALGQSTGRIAEAFGMKVRYLIRPNQKSGLRYLKKEELLKTSDIISIHCPYTPETKGLITKKDFELMKPTAILINTARGGIINEEDLAEALLNCQIAGAGFDVAEGEPLKPDSPLQKILHLPNFILTPHNAWSSREAIDLLLNKLRVAIEGLVAEFYN